MKISKKIENGLMTVGIPAFIVTALVVVTATAHGFWNQIIVVIFATIIGLVIANQKKFYREDDYYAGGIQNLVLRNLVIVCTSTFMLTTIASIENVNLKLFSNTHIIILSGITLLVFVLMIIDGLLTRMNFNEKNLCNGYNQIILLFFSSYLLSSIYVHFGTQYVWLPTISLTAILITGFLDPRIEQSIKIKKIHLFLLPIDLGIISTIIQFSNEISNFFVMIFTSTLFTMWSYEYKVWELIFWMLGFGILLILFRIFINAFGEKFSYFLSSTYIEIWKLFHPKTMKARYEKQKLEQEELASRVEAEKKRIESAKQASREKATDAIAIVKSGDTFSWTHVCRVANEFGQDSKEILSLIDSIWKKDLNDTEIIEISELKKQIVYGVNFQAVLQIIDNIARKTYDDDYLISYMKQIKKIIRETEDMEEYKGYPDMMHEIKTKCKTIWTLLEEQQAKSNEKKEMAQ